MGNTENGFGKKRDHNQYGEVDKDIKKGMDVDPPKPPNKNAANKENKTKD